MFGIIFLLVVIAILMFMGLVFLYSWIKYEAPEVVKTLVQITSLIVLLALLLTYVICQALETKQRNIPSGEEYSISKLLGDEK